ncbi:WD-40 repeat-containing protein [Tieghemostelium lacteum]|uniref:Elongator complex protein 2 n=1 Tax=Tieghemostelium lacteum TaxID=361077 RepID=A0A151ZHG2_TIELA|nr:WD-40 repeat-containing protein [Tieghemostelium lacteum]|eukprot:KYQ93304.1 WD-40 repeat-containing protein [Tieghemostelium lacteum]
MNSMKSNIEFISIGCNCLGDAIRWGRNELVAYCAQNYVAILNPYKNYIQQTLIGHSDRVNHVVWVPNILEKDYEKRFMSPETELISVSSDHTIINWRKDGDIFTVHQQLKEHKDSVTYVSVLDLQDGSLLMCTTSVDSTIKLWKRDAPTNTDNNNNKEWPQWRLIQSIDFTPKCMECCDMTFIPGTWTPILALGGLEPKIHIYIQQENSEQFKKLVALQGHQDWIKNLSFCKTDEGEVLLASSSQDFRIRLWKLTKFQQTNTSSQTSSDLLSSLTTGSSGVTSLSTKGYLFNHNQTKYSILLESVLSGHEDWVYSIHWQPAQLKVLHEGKEPQRHQPMSLISASMDKTSIIWRPDVNSGIWMDDYRVGDMGGNILGLYGSVFSPTSQYMLSHGYNGAFHFWKFSSSEKKWEPQIIVSGHFGPVQDLMWSPDYSYFISCSSDRTLRLFSEWKDKETQENRKIWNEIARPQIHGYDLECFTFVHKKSHLLVSGAEEKIMRVFVGSQNFVDTLYNISKVVPSKSDQTPRPLAANQPSLGLSNKPYFKEGELVENIEGINIQEQQAQNNEVSLPSGGGGEDGEGGGDFYDDQIPFNPEVLTEPPFEEHLLQSSLWPEIFKLYGHGNEMVTVASSFDGQYLASSCRASSPDQATVRIWNCSNWKEVANLKGHTLSVVNLAFSHNDRYLLGVSRDRMWTLWEKSQNPQDPFTKVISIPKSHGRIIWSCSWSHDDKYFATGSRDKVVKVWSVDNVRDKGGLISTLPTFGSGVTCVEFSPIIQGIDMDTKYYLLAVGEEDGKITIWKATIKTVDNKTTLEWTCIHTVPKHISHILDVRRIRWRDIPTTPKNTKEINYQIATASTDNSVRIFNLTFEIN